MTQPLLISPAPPTLTRSNTCAPSPALPPSQTGVSAITDEEAAKKVGDTTKRWWSAVADTTTGILSDLAAPDDEEDPAFPRPDEYTNGAGGGLGKPMEGYGGGGSGSNVSRQPRKQKVSSGPRHHPKINI